jgi:hypothetical protein
LALSPKKKPVNFAGKKRGNSESPHSTEGECTINLFDYNTNSPWNLMETYKNNFIGTPYG